ncbi:MAG: hypothetical protein JXB17_13635 [Bacteroidales bacterium]|nr:hypothetical protein [Bacteroidales bacterium]
MDFNIFSTVDEYIKSKVGLEDNILYEIRKSCSSSTMPDANAGDIFRNGKGSKEKELESKNEMVLRELGQSQVEIAFLKKKLRQ